jgi:hypothetical protein
MGYEGFTVLSNYLFHVRKSCLDRYAKGSLSFRALHEGILESNIATSVTRHSDTAADNVRKTLHNCWLTELNLHQEFYFDIDAIDVAYFLGWKIVQAYYVCFLSLRALYELSLGTSKFGHNDLLNRFAEDNEALGFIYPFNISYGKGGFKNLSGPFTHINPISKHYKSADYIALWCRTTFEEHQKDKWQRTVHPRKKWGKLSDVDCEDVSLLDCLYRLRKKHNYESVDRLPSGVSENEGRDFDISLSAMTFSFLSMSEIILWQLLSVDERKSIIAEYSQKTGGLSRQTLLKIRLEKFY